MRKGVLAALVAALAWGYVYATTQQIVEKVRPLPLLASIYIVGSIPMLPVALYSLKEIEAGVTAHPFGYVSLLVGILVAEYAIMASVSSLGGTEAALLETSYPIWTAVFLFLMHGHKPTWSTVAGGTLMLAGAMVIAFAEKKS